jgi:SAM-dependent methyltransferase
MTETRSAEGKSWERWLHEIRRIEFELMMPWIPLDRSATVLELGSGDGFQLDLLRQRFDRVFAIDPEHRPARASGFAYAMAEALPFRDGAFGLVVSNCVVEHLKDRRGAVEETLRVLRPGGYVAHVVPAPFWKAASLLLNPVGYPLRVAEKWQALRQARREPQEPESTSRRPTPQPGFLQVLGRWFYPPIHGTFPSHRAEIRSYARERWVEVFTHPQLVRVAEVPLLSYTQFGFLRFRWISLRRWLGRHGLDSSRAFILRKVE